MEGAVLRLSGFSFPITVTGEAISCLIFQTDKYGNSFFETQ